MFDLVSLSSQSSSPSISLSFSLSHPKPKTLPNLSLNLPLQSLILFCSSFVKDQDLVLLSPSSSLSSKSGQDCFRSRSAIRRPENRLTRPRLPSARPRRPCSPSKFLARRAEARNRRRSSLSSLARRADAQLAEQMPQLAEHPSWLAEQPSAGPVCSPSSLLFAEILRPVCGV